MKFYSAPSATAGIIVATLPLNALGLYAAITEGSIFGVLLLIIGSVILLYCLTSVVVIDEDHISFRRLSFTFWKARLSEIRAEDGGSGEFGFLPALLIVRENEGARVVVGEILKSQFSPRTIEAVRLLIHSEQ